MISGHVWQRISQCLTPPHIHALLITFGIYFSPVLFILALLLSTPAPPPSPVSTACSLPFTLPKHYPLSNNPLVAAGLTFNDNLVNQVIADSAIFTSTRLTLWRHIHAMQLTRESSTDPNATSLEYDFQMCLVENFQCLTPACVQALYGIYVMCNRDCYSMITTYPINSPTTIMTSIVYL
jgi:hypothetical protein